MSPQVQFDVYFIIIVELSICIAWPIASKGSSNREKRKELLTVYRHQQPSLIVIRLRNAINASNGLSV